MKITKRYLKQLVKEELERVRGPEARARRSAQVDQWMAQKYASRDDARNQPGYIDSQDKDYSYDLARSTPGAQMTMDPLPDEEYYLHMDPDSPYYEEDIESQLRQQAEELGIDPEVYMAKYRASRKKT